MYNIYLELKNSKSSQYLSTISISIPPDIQNTQSPTVSCLKISVRDASETYAL